MTLRFWRSIRQTLSTTRSVASSVVGLTSTMCFFQAIPYRSGSAWTATRNAGSTGMNNSVKSSDSKPYRAG